MTWLVRFALRALYPRAAGLPGIADTQLDEFLPRFRRETTWLLWLGVVSGALLFQLSPLLTIYVPLPAVLLWRSALDRHAARAATHPLYHLRSAILVTRIAAGFCWGADAEVRRAVGLVPYAGPDPDDWRTG